MATKTRQFNYSTEFLLVALLSLSLGSAGLALAQTPFYQGKTITIIHGREPGGAGDMRVKAMVPFIQKHIPGNPTIVGEYMPGGGGRKAANYIYKVAKPDGLNIGNLGAGLYRMPCLAKLAFNTILISLPIWAPLTVPPTTCS